ncbi:MAG TPA: hypothetical protein VMB48_16980 [Steroidobacteraceae bacterium]|nr:hypothetical protein [Steroidobacteraceae bacterium]
MNPPPDEPRIPAGQSAASRLEQRISGLLASIPPRSAPAELVPRVWAELARRRALPWWRRSVLEWPRPAQLAFLAAGLALAAAAVALRLRAPLPAPGQILPGVQALIGLCGVLAHSASVLLHAIPGAWVRGGLLLGFTVYAALFALLALAHRLLDDTPARTH